MEFIIVDAKGERFVFPVNPEEVNISRQKGLETVNILSAGEFDFTQGDRVKEISFSSFFPQVYDASFCKYENIPDPQNAMNKLNTILVSKQPIRFIITGTAINVPALLSSHNTTFRGGESGDVFFDLTIRTWRDMKVQKKTGAQNVSNKKSRDDLKQKSKTYIVKTGDSLSKIAKLELGNSSEWQKIYNLNVKLIGKNPNMIKAGQKLVLP